MSTRDGMKYGLLMLLLMAAPLYALDLEPGRYYRDLGSEVTYYIDQSPVDTPPAELAPLLERDFSATPSGQIDFGFRAGTVWLHLPVVNTGADAGEWLLALNSRFMNELRVYLRTADERQLLLDNTERSTFSQRPVDYRLLAVGFTLPGRASGDLLVAYRSRGTTYLPIALETPQSFADGRILANTKSGGFYTAAALMLLYGLFQFLLPGNRIYLHYIVYLAAGVMYVFHMDGLSFQYLWPELPRWNAFASLPLGLLINILAANFSRHFLESWRTAPRFDFAMRAMIWLSVLLILCGALIEDRYVKWLSFWLTSGGAVIYLSAGVHALFQGVRSARFYVVGWVGICSASILSSVIHSLPGAIPVSLSFDISKVGILFDALMFGMAMTDRANDIRRQRDEALRREMVVLAEHAQARSDLAAAQRGREDALQMAAQSNMQLAAASHDIRQPLGSLKLALAGLREQGGAGKTGAMLESVEYLDALVTSYLDQSRNDEQPVADLDLQEVFPVQLVLDGVQSMFASEAQARGVELRVRPSTLKVRGNPVATVRVVGNLVKNAVNNTRSGRILLGCRREEGACVICVADTGCGMDAQTLLRVQDAFEQGDDAEGGHGLGLHIVASLCARLGYHFDISSAEGRGTFARVRLARQA